MHIPFTQLSCFGRKQISRGRASRLFTSSADGSVTMELPTVTEYIEIPDDRSEIPTHVISLQPHLYDLPLPVLKYCC